MQPIIILTLTVNINPNKDWVFQTNPKDRLEIYLKSIRNWLYKTNLSIILVDNSGYTFEELKEEKEIFKHRMEIISFTENNLDEAKYLENNDSKGASELFSINYAFFHSQLINKDSFIIKITGRFFIPEFEEYINQFDLNNYDCLIQNSSLDNGLRCEIVGSHYTKFFYIFNIFTITKNYQFSIFIEQLYYERTRMFKNILECKVFPIEETQRGGINQTFKEL